jgi:hypothetical protein
VEVRSRVQHGNVGACAAFPRWRHLCYRGCELQALFHPSGPGRAYGDMLVVVGKRDGAGRWAPRWCRRRPGGDGLDPHHLALFGGLVGGGQRSLLVRCRRGLSLSGGEASFDFHSSRFWWTLGMDIRLGRNP